MSIDSGVVYVDGDPLQNGVADAIVRFYDQGNENFQPLVNFLEKVLTNPSEHSRTQLYDWLARHEFSIAEDGDILAYKGVGHGPEFLSSHSGGGWVDGEEVKGQVPNVPGTEITLPRSSVQHDPKVGCAFGLHVANWGYAHRFNSATVLVKVNPRDVVSVPTECNWDKVRTCRYLVLREVTEEITDALVLGIPDETVVPDDFGSDEWFGVDAEVEVEDDDEGQDPTEFRKKEFDRLPFATLQAIVKDWGVGAKAEKRSKPAFVKVLAKEAANRRHNLKRGYKASKVA